MFLNSILLLRWKEDTTRSIQVLFFHTVIRFDDFPLPPSFESASFEERIHECQC